MEHRALTAGLSRARRARSLLLPGALAVVLVVALRSPQDGPMETSRALRPQGGPEQSAVLAAAVAVAMPGSIGVAMPGALQYTAPVAMPGAGQYARPVAAAGAMQYATPVAMPAGLSPFPEQAAWAGLAAAASPILLVGGVPVATGNQPGADLGQAFVPPSPVASRPQFKMLPFVEAHWQGLEMIELTPPLATALGLDPNLKGIIADDVTPPADACRFQGGDVILSVDGVPTPDLTAFIAASERVRGHQSVQMSVLRKGQVFPLTLWSLVGRLGNANGDTAPMIPPGAVSPHAYQGKCSGCHRIGTTGTLPVDQGDLLAKTAPVIRGGQVRPHRDRGSCALCHQILP